MFIGHFEVVPGYTAVDPFEFVQGLAAVAVFVPLGYWIDRHRRVAAAQS